MTKVEQNTDPRLRRAFSACRRHFIWAAAFSALINLLYIAPTLYMLQIYERVVPSQGFQTLFLLTAVLLVSLATLTILDRSRSRLLVRAGLQFDRSLGPAILDASFGTTKIADARQGLRAMDNLRSAIAGPVAGSVFDVPWIPIYILACCFIHPIIGALAVTGCVVLPVLTWLSEKRTNHKFRLAQTLSMRSHANQDNAVAHAEVVRALGMRRALVLRQLGLRQAMLSSVSEASFTSNEYLSVGKFTRLSLQSLALGIGALLAIAHSISPAAIFASSFLIARAMSPIDQVTAHWRSIATGWASYREIKSMLSGSSASLRLTTLPPPRGALSAENLFIQNEGSERPTILGISFNLAHGSTLAIVGPSGSGKSTLVRALVGAIAARDGTIRFDGADIRDWDPEQLAKFIGYLPQAPTLFEGTVADNIARFAGAGHPDLNQVDGKAVTAAQKAGAHEMVLSLPGGYNYKIGLGGAGLSAGQAQRIALARALFDDPNLLVLDEPNAHLDQEGDTQLFETLKNLKAAGKTIVIITHKLGLMPLIDQILILNGGRITSFGPREQMLKFLAPSKAR